MREKSLKSDESKDVLAETSSGDESEKVLMVVR